MSAPNNVTVTQTALNTSTATLICPQRPSRRRVLIQNIDGTSTNTAFIGNTGVTTSTGWKIAGALGSVELYTNVALYAIAGANTPTVTVLEEY